MLNHRVSYWKTSLPAGFAGSCLLVMTRVAATPAHGVARGLVVATGVLVALPLLSVGISGLVVLYRDTTTTRRKRDLFPMLNHSRSEAVLALGRTDAGLLVRQLVRTLLGLHLLVVGDEVEVRSFDEIRGTLDDSGCLEGLPFMPEMLGFCGQRARVFRRLDKIYDYGGAKVVRRLKHTVLLHQMRCDGAAHGGCQAGCYVIWKEAWLRTPRKRAAAQAPAGPGDTGIDAGALLQPPSITGQPGPVTYRCQFTQLATASTPLTYWDPRPDWRPLAAGNVTVAASALALLTRLFNRVQAIRGGITFPLMDHGQQLTTPAITRDIRQGDRVRVMPAERILQTLDKNGKNRGLWFDRDMLKHCEHEHEVLKRVDRIIDDATGQMRTMKTPCIVLRDVTYSGEFLRFCAQEEHLYWREAWLQPLPSDAAVASEADSLRRLN